MSLSHLQRLNHIRDLLRAQGPATSQTTRLVCMSGAGFTSDLRQAATQDPAIQLVDLQRLYHGE